MKRIKKKGLLFLVSTAVYIAVTLWLHLYNHELILLSYFLLFVIWVFAFSQNPYLGIRGWILSDVSNGINRMLGRKLLPWTEMPKLTQFTFKDLFKALFLVLLFHFIFIFILIKLSPATKVVNNFMSASLNVTTVLFDLLFWASFLFIRAIYLTLTKDRF